MSNNISQLEQTRANAKEKARKAYKRRQFWEGIALFFIAAGGILAAVIGGLFLFLLVFSIPILGVGLTVFSIFTLITTGFNIWAVVGLIVGLFLISRVKFHRNKSE